MLETKQETSLCLLSFRERGAIPSLTEGFLTFCLGLGNFEFFCLFSFLGESLYFGASDRLSGYVHTGKEGLVTSGNVKLRPHKQNSLAPTGSVQCVVKSQGQNWAQADFPELSGYSPFRLLLIPGMLAI